MALQAKRPHIAPQTQHGKRSGIFYELFFRDILLQGRRQLAKFLQNTVCPRYRNYNAVGSNLVLFWSSSEFVDLGTGLNIDGFSVKVSEIPRTC